MTNQQTRALDELKNNWNQFGKDDPLFAILGEEGKSRNKWNREEFFATGVAEIGEAVDYVGGQVAELNFGKSLDFGCGVGRCTQALEQHFSSSVGVDISPSMVELAGQLVSESQNCSYVLNTVDDLSVFADEEFDFVYRSRVLQHIPPSLAELYIGEFFRVVKPGGVVLFQLPSERLTAGGMRSLSGRVRSFGKFIIGNTLLGAYRRIRYGTSAMMGMNVIDEATVRGLIESYGGRIEDVVNDGFAGPEYDSRRYCTVKI